jgi:hypothetical protein
MAVEGLGGGSGKGVAFLVATEVMYTAIAAACSSPQTTELNAASRSKTLMKWVHIGVAQGLLLVIIGAAYDKREAVPILIGGTLAGALLYIQYVHAKKAGLTNCGPPTETHNAPVPETVTATTNGNGSYPWN